MLAKYSVPSDDCGADIGPHEKWNEPSALVEAAGDPVVVVLLVLPWWIYHIIGVVSCSEERVIKGGKVLTPKCVGISYTVQ
jgi:hypothetical protein